MNRRLPFSPNETDAILYVIISVLLLMSVNQVLSQPRIMENVTASANMCRQKTTHTGSLPYENLFSTSLTNSSGKIAMAAPLSLKNLLENQSTPLTSKVNVCANIVIDEKEMAILSESFTKLPQSISTLQGMWSEWLRTGVKVGQILNSYPGSTIRES